MRLLGNSSARVRAYSSQRPSHYQHGDPECDPVAPNAHVRPELTRYPASFKGPNGSVIWECFTCSIPGVFSGLVSSATLRARPRVGERVFLEKADY